jgi:uncharacterized membrane protein YeiB
MIEKGLVQVYTGDGKGKTTAALGLAIFAAQLLLSHWWLRRFGQGPLERAWRKWTYSGMPPPAALKTGE